MRFLHTADWHIGKPLRGRTRFDEYAAALDEIVAIARDSQGRRRPPGRRRLRLAGAARRGREAGRTTSWPACCPSASPASSSPATTTTRAGWPLSPGCSRACASTSAPTCVRASEGGVVSVPSRDGREVAQVAVLPFVPERKVVDACSLVGPEHEWYEEYARRLEQVLHLLTAGFTPEDGEPGDGTRPHLRRAGGHRRAAAAPGRGLRRQRAAAARERAVHRPRAPAPAAGDRGAVAHVLRGLDPGAGLRREGAAEAGGDRGRRTGPRAEDRVGAALVRAPPARPVGHARRAGRARGHRGRRLPARGGPRRRSAARASPSWSASGCRTRSTSASSTRARRPP